MRTVKQSTIRVLMAKKRYKVHHYNRSCGNCGLGLREDDEIIFVEQSIRSGSNYFHKHPEGCANASDKPMIIPQGYKERLYLLDDLL